MAISKNKGQQVAQQVIKKLLRKLDAETPKKIIYFFLEPTFVYGNQYLSYDSCATHVVQPNITT